MSEYTQIQTYARSDQHTFSSILRKYRIVLERLGCDDQQVIEWLSQLSWPTSDDDSFGDIYASPFILSPAAEKQITCAGLAVSLFMVSPVPILEETQPCWVGLNLLFEAEELRIDGLSTYQPEAGEILWHIMRELASSFREIGVYFTDEWQENRSWRAITEGRGEAWAFDLAIFPRELSKHFSVLPAGFQGTLVAQDFGFAQANRWSRLPWVEAEHNHNSQPTHESSNQS